MRTLFIVLTVYSFLDLLAHKMGFCGRDAYTGWGVLGLFVLIVEFVFLEPNASIFIAAQMRTCALGIVCLILGRLLRVFRWEVYHRFWHGGVALAFLLLESHFVILNTSFECGNPVLFVVSVSCGWIMCWSAAELVCKNQMFTEY